MSNNAEPAQEKPLLPLSLAALGVVYGDIGTSPLYAFRESFLALVSLTPSHETVLGILSTIFWSLIIVITVKYLLVVMRADNHGEGGIIALVALLNPRAAKLRSVRGLLILLGLFGAALLYGDGTITPAISVLSAIEGLTLATPALTPMIVPITLVILILLFWVQRHGTYRIGRIFGPVMLLWFATLAVLGIHGILQAPEVLVALSPHYAVTFFMHNGISGFLILGAVFLAVTGGETLYADMGHFGPTPIRLAWFALVLPALLLNYFGQGALVLSTPAQISHPFYHLAPPWALYPLVVLATTATVIASQAVISGVFSLTRQAIQLGLLPRMRIVQTHDEAYGQIYIPAINVLLMLATLALVLGFQSSSALASAYGLAISADMVITTILILYLAHHWHWNPLLLLLMGSLFLIVDIAFFSANLLKFLQGGWYPLLIGVLIFTIMTTWRSGRRLLREKLLHDPLPLAQIAQVLEEGPIARTQGSAVFMSSDSLHVPAVLRHHIAHNQALQKTVILLHIDIEEIPHVSAAQRLDIRELDEAIYHIRARYGFMQAVNVPVALRLCETQGLTIDLDNTTYYLGRETLILAEDKPGLSPWREKLFSFLSRNAYRATAFYNIPADRVVELGIQVEL